MQKELVLDEYVDVLEHFLICLSVAVSGTLVNFVCG